MLSKIHTICFELIELTYEANSIKLGEVLRSEKQKAILTKFMILIYLIEVGKDFKCFTFHQFEIASNQIYDCEKILINWIKSDNTRVKSLNNMENVN